MPLPVAVHNEARNGEHAYTVLDLADEPAFLGAAADEYVRLRTEAVVPLEPVDLDGIDTLSVEGLRRFLFDGVVTTTHTADPLDTLRSDFGETSAYLVLSDRHGTNFGYQSVRDRERADMAGRGIDAVGIEWTRPLTLVLCETKVSDEANSPPQVVDRSRDGLRNQHRAHLRDRVATAGKITDAARLTRDRKVSQALYAAAYLLKQNSTAVRIVCACLLVRSVPRHGPNDFGSFQVRPADYVPANIRFYVLRTPKPIASTIDAWALAIQSRRN